MPNELRKASVGLRYGISTRSVDRMAATNRLPKPRYLPGSRIPFWFEEELDAQDRAATLQPTCNADPAGFARLLDEVSATASSRKAKDLILAASLKGELRSLNEAQLEVLQDLLHEK